MRTPEQEPDSLAHTIDPHPPREPRAICPPTPPPEIDQGSGLHHASFGHKEEEDILGNTTPEHTAADLAVAAERHPSTTSERSYTSVEFDASASLPDDHGGDMLPNSDGADMNILKTDVAVSRQLTIDASSVPSPASLISDRDPAEIFHPDHNSGEDPSTEAEADSETDIQTRRCEPGPREAPSERPPNGAISIETSRNSDPPAISSLSSATTPFELSTKRLYPYYPSSFLRPGSRFSGTQQSDHQIYSVDVEILTLSVPDSSLTGYLRICGLTEDHPTLTTFFSGEIIGGPHHKYGFQTEHKSWGASDLTDLQHWAQFPAWKQLNKGAKDDIAFKYPPAPASLGQAGSDAAEYEYDSEVNQGWWRQPNVFMRWKEWFLVPDHRVTIIPGASFEGFYYICFSQLEGSINGIYFHGKSKKFQQLKLNHKYDRGVCGAMEFR